MKSIFLICIAWTSLQPALFSQTANPGQYQYVFTVAQDGTGDYSRIQDAIDAMRVYPLAPITLYIKKGVYHEKIELPANNTDVSFIGEDVDSTIITWNDYSGKGRHSTFTSYTVKISGNRFRAENISFANTAGPVGQALALYVDADQAVFRNCKFLGNQDTLFAAGEQSAQLFDSCYIEGTTDYIFGPATAVFRRCTLRSKSNSYITAASTTAGKPYGFVFLSCRLIADSAVSKLFLGRPWRAHAKTVFLDCELPAVIAPEGWNNWGNPENEKTVLYAEYKNRGNGAVTTNRVNWSKQLNTREAAQYALPRIFKGGTSWYAVPATPFNPPACKTLKPEVIELYGIVPNNRQVPDLEQSVTRDNVTRISKISRPSLTVFRPQKPNGQAVIICPGGGYAILAFDKEGTRVAEAFNRWGITAFVLKNRLPDDSINIDKSLAPLQDAQQAIRYVRSHAKAFGIHPGKIGIMGFSAGGHLAATASTHFQYRSDPGNTDTTSVRPDFSVLIYPVISFDSTITHAGSRNNLIGKNPDPETVRFFSNEIQVVPATPPAFLVHAGDDAAVPVENSLRYYQSCIRNKVPAEMHLYPGGGHGFGLNNKTTDDNWFDRLINWLSRR